MGNELQLAALDAFWSPCHTMKMAPSPSVGTWSHSKNTDRVQQWPLRIDGFRAGVNRKQELDQLAAVFRIA